MKHYWDHGIHRRTFFKGLAGGALTPLIDPLQRLAGALEPRRPSELFWIKDIPQDPFVTGGNRHAGVEKLLNLMGNKGLKFYRSSMEDRRSGPLGMIRADDVVLIKVNAQWKYRGCTNSDLVRGLIQAVLDHPDGFTGEAVIIENGQGRGSLNCDTSPSYGDSLVRANAQNRNHSFLYLVNSVFDDPRVSAYLLDDIRDVFIGGKNHAVDGYRRLGNVSYPCFTTTGGNRVELKEGLWTGGGYSQKLKLINVPVLKHHDVGGSEITASLKHFYGVISMSDGYSGLRHYEGLGKTCGKMVVSVRPPVLNIIDAIWVSHESLKGYPASTTHRADQILAGQDPVALDYIAAARILHPIDGNLRHHPDHPGIKKWLSEARRKINKQGGLRDPEAGLFVRRVTGNPSKIKVYRRSLK
jgi:uncharacterized protein (DUF362 family)